MAKATLAAALEELANGLTGARMPAIYVEAVISPKNIVSQRIAAAIFEDAPISITDSESGLPALHYVRRVDLPMQRG